MASLLFLFACAKAPDAPTNASAPATETPPAPLVLGEPDASGQATELTIAPLGAATYEECKARVEGQQSAGECSTDADCARAGCSGEVCVPKALVANVMTTCDVQPCFALLDTCGCAAGLCTWSLKSSP